MIKKFYYLLKKNKKIDRFDPEPENMETKIITDRKTSGDIVFEQKHIFLQLTRSEMDQQGYRAKSQSQNSLNVVKLGSWGYSNDL